MMEFQPTTVFEGMKNWLFVVDPVESDGTPTAYDYWGDQSGGHVMVSLYEDERYLMTAYAINVWEPCASEGYDISPEDLEEMTLMVAYFGELNTATPEGEFQRRVPWINTTAVPARTQSVTCRNAGERSFRLGLAWNENVNAEPFVAKFLPMGYGESRDLHCDDELGCWLQ